MLRVLKVGVGGGYLCYKRGPKIEDVCQTTPPPPSLITIFAFSKNQYQPHPLFDYYSPTTQAHYITRNPQIAL